MSAKKLPMVSVITVNYNGKHMLKDHFDSLMGLIYPEDRIEFFMVDNCSRDDSATYVRELYPRVKIIKNNINNYCRANNLGFKRAKGELVALINNDVKLDKGWLFELVRVFGKDRKIGAAAGKVLFSDGRLQGAGHYAFPDFYWGDRGFKEDDFGQYNKLQKVKSISHCAALYRKICLDSVGFLDEDFMMYMEDVDMSIRVRAKGWGIAYCPKATGYHKFHGSADEDTVSYYCERNRLFLIAKHYPQRLSGALLGKGHFTVLKDKDELFKILPSVFVKLIKHHDAKTVISAVPGIFEEIDKILNLEKRCLIEQVDNLKNAHSDLINRVIPQKDQQLKDRGTETAILNERINHTLQLVSDREEILRNKDSDINNLKNAVSEYLQQLSQKAGELSQNARHIQERDSEISVLENKIQLIYDSETYRFIAQPVWRIMEKFKKKKIKPHGDTQAKILVIKPYCVGAEETERALDNLTNRALKKNIILLANLFEQDYDRLLNNKNISGNIFYCPTRNKLNGIGLCKLVLRIRRSRFHEAILLIGDSAYQGYRKGKLLAAFSRAKSINCYFTVTGRLEPLGVSSRSQAKAARELIYGNIILLFLLFFFLAFVVIPLKLRKILRR